MSHPLRIVFAGTPDFARDHLQTLLDQYSVTAVYTQPDRPTGRGRKCIPSPVKTLALQHHIEVFQPKTFRENVAQETLQSLTPDLMVVVAYGLILPQDILCIPRCGCVNIHASLLPAWRGASPIQRAIMAGDRMTGITAIQMEAGLDTGAILQQETALIDAQDTTTILHEKLAKLGCRVLNDVIEKKINNTLRSYPQNHSLASYAKKITKAEGRIDWTRPAIEIARCVRAFNPWPVAHSMLNGKVIRCWQAESKMDTMTSSWAPGTLVAADKTGLTVGCGQGTLILTHIQLPNRRVMPVHDILNSNAHLFAPGARFDEVE